MFIPKLFYNDNASEGGGTDAQVADKTADTTAATTENKDTPVAEIPKAFISEDEAKEFGFDSPEALKQFLKKQKESNVPDEEKQKQLELDNAEFRKFSIQKGLAKEADFKSYQTLTERQNYDLVFDEHLKEFKEENPEITDPKELAEAAKEDFEKTYKLNSENPKAKEKGQAKIDKIAKELRSPVESVITTAKEKYAEEKEIRAKLPDFQKLVEAKVKQNTPDKSIIYKYKDGEEEIPIEIDLTEADRKEMAKSFATHDNYKDYAKGKTKELEATFDEQMQQWVRAFKSDAIVKSAIEQGIKIGQKKGSNVGADNPFALIDKGTNLSGNTGKSLDDEIRESHNRAAQKYQK